MQANASTSPSNSLMIAHRLYHDVTKSHGIPRLWHVQVIPNKARGRTLVLQSRQENPRIESEPSLLPAQLQSRYPKKEHRAYRSNLNRELLEDLRLKGSIFSIEVRSTIYAEDCSDASIDGATMLLRTQYSGPQKKLAEREFLLQPAYPSSPAEP